MTHSQDSELAHQIVNDNDLCREEVAQHNNISDAWIIVDNKVYDVTSYVDEHPGGTSILDHVGDDATVGFHGPQHPASVFDVLATYYVGDLKI
jgi:cytochrome b involved in lipid metabolism